MNKWRVRLFAVRSNATEKTRYTSKNSTIGNRIRKARKKHQGVRYKPIADPAKQLRVGGINHADRSNSDL